MKKNYCNIQKIVAADLYNLNRLRDRVLPIKVGRTVVDSVRENFRAGGFYGQPWQDVKRHQLGFHGVDGYYGPLLSRTNHLRDSTSEVLRFALSCRLQVTFL